MNKTTIEWARNPDGTPGYTHNPISGCKYHTPEGLCLGGGFPCYAFKLANGRLKARYLANRNIAKLPFPQGGEYGVGHLTEALHDPFYPRFWPERARESFGAYTGGAGPKGTFVCDMGDLFGIGIPEEWTRRILSHISMSYYREHRFYLLTKQPQNLIKFSPFPENCWVGVTACNEPAFQKAMHYLPYIQAQVKYLSLEPMLSRILTTPGQLQRYISWVIIGAQTKPTVYPKIEWVEEIVKVCDKAGVKVFLKDNLRPLLPQRMPFHDVACYWADDHTHQLYTNRLRQEIPDG